MIFKYEKEDLAEKSNSELEYFTFRLQDSIYTHLQIYEFCFYVYTNLRLAVTVAFKSLASVTSS